MQHRGMLQKNNRILAVVYGVLMAVALCLWAWCVFCLPGHSYTLQNGEVDLTGYRRFDHRMIYLDGEWEYFPDVLLISEGVENPEPAGMVKMPVRYGGGGLETTKTGKASFRVMLKNVPEKTLLMQSIPGYLGNYTIYVNGKAYVDNTQVISPNYYDYVMFRGGREVELVLELPEQVVGVDCMPILSDNDLQFHNFFLVRLICFVIIGFLSFGYIVLPITYNVWHQEELRTYALIGMLTLLAFVLETVWFYGLLDTVQKVITPLALRYLRLITETLLHYMVFHFFRMVYCREWAKWMDWVVNGLYLLCAITAAAMLSMELPLAEAERVLDVSVIVGLVATEAMAFQSVLRQGGHAMIASIGTLVLSLGLWIKRECSYVEVVLPLQMVLPICVFISLVCWSLLIASSRRRDIAALEKALDVEQTMAKTQAAFLASQIQPHFLYNTMTSIQELCYTNPPQAADLVVRFSNYLRQNIDFMDYKDKIAFTDELGHIDNYIELQRARFGVSIHFVRQIEFERFMLPPLTVQPLVENAVTHGIRKGNGRGTVFLRSYRVGEEIVVEVEDNGAGFDVNAVHSRSLENIRKRVEGAMAGKLEIDSRPGEGTRVRLRLPYAKAVIV